MMSPITLTQHKIDYYVIIAGLKSEPMDRVVISLPGWRLLISNLPGVGFEHTCRIPQNLVIKQVFSKPCQVNLISKGHSPGILYLHVTSLRSRCFFEGVILLFVQCLLQLQLCFLSSDLVFCEILSINLGIAIILLRLHKQSYCCCLASLIIYT